MGRVYGGHYGGSPYADSGHYGGATVVYDSAIHDPGHLSGGHYQSRVYSQQPAGDGLAAGKRYFKQGSYPLAVEAFLQAVLAAPQDGVPKLHFGLSHFAVGDYEYAVYAIRRGMDRVPNQGEEEMDLRYLYGRSADFDQHLQALTAHVNLDDATGDDHFLLGYVLYSSGRYAPASEQFELALKMGAEDRHAARLHQLAMKRTAG